jgi:hypothetical protein
LKSIVNAEVIRAISRPDCETALAARMRGTAGSQRHRRRQSVLAEGQARVFLMLDFTNFLNQFDNV